MPTYEYHCESCDENFDVVQSFHDDPLTACPTCGAPVRKVFGNVGIVFKGSGFYKNDSRNGSSAKPKEGGDTSPESDSGTKSSDSAKDGKTSSPSDSPSTPTTTPSPAASDSPSTASKETPSKEKKAPAS